MILLRLVCSSFWVDVRLREISRRWIVSAEPFEGIVDELLASLPASGLR